jgi:Ala-tRNA(Pro) deacylase
MGIAISLQDYLDGRGVAYDVVAHEPTSRSSMTARAARISEDNLAKGVLIRYRNGYILAIIPASHDVRLDELGALYERHVNLATEAEVAKIFGDCEVGAVPPVANAYGLEAVMDDSLEGFNDIYFEAGDHRTLVHVKGRDFHKLMPNVPHAKISDRH